MKNQFTYTLNITEPGVDENTPGKERKALCSFNLDKIIRSFEKADGGLIVILDDFHEEMVKVPDTINTNSNRIIRGKKEKAIVQSEIHLSPVDKERFFKLLNIENE